MAVECGVITALLLIISVVFFFRKRKDWAFATLPLMLVPLTEFIIDFVLVRFCHVTVSTYAAILAPVFAVAVSCAWIGFAANRFKRKSTIISYIVISNIFNDALAAILINNILCLAGAK